MRQLGGAADILDGWYAKTETRRQGTSAGSTDTCVCPLPSRPTPVLVLLSSPRPLSRGSYFFHASGKRFRSRSEVARWLGLDTAAPPPKQKKMKVVHSAVSATMVGALPSGMANPTGAAVLAGPVKASPTTTVLLDAVVVGPAYAS